MITKLVSDNTSSIVTISILLSIATSSLHFDGCPDRIRIDFKQMFFSCVFGVAVFVLFFLNLCADKTKLGIIILDRLSYNFDH